MGGDKPRPHRLLFLYRVGVGFLMEAKMHFDINWQPDNTTCGPTCLHAIYRYYHDSIPLQTVAEEVPNIPEGGTLDVYLACHALRRGYKTTIFPYNLQIFDPTWSDIPSKEIAAKIAQELQQKNLYVFMSADYNGKKFSERYSGNRNRDQCLPRLFGTRRSAAVRSYDGCPDSALSQKIHSHSDGVECHLSL